jgi:hypothetical protein
MTVLKCENLQLRIDEWILLSITALINSNRGLLICFFDMQILPSIRFEKPSLVDSLGQTLFPTFLQARFAVPAHVFDAIVLMIHIGPNYVLRVVCFFFSSPCFVRFPDVPFLLSRVVVFLDQWSPYFS